MSSSIVPDADASRPRSGILTPTSEGSLNRNDGNPPLSESRKRKRSDSVTTESLLKPSITLKPHPPNMSIPPRSLQPLMLLPREHLSLSYLDLGAPRRDLPATQAFESNIKILDLESRMGSTPSVLIARLESKRSVFAIERDGNGLYVACKLGSWVNLEAIGEQATVVCRQRLYPTKEASSEANATTNIPTPKTGPIVKEKRSAMEAIQTLVRKRARSQSVATLDEAGRLGSGGVSQTEGSKVPQTALSVVDKPLMAPTVAAEAEQQQTAESIFDNVRAQYFEALYKSKGSLAYFAKGPLSRARSAFHLDLESNLDMNDLIEFLKSMVITTVQVDKKYRETLPDLISKIKPAVDSSDEGAKKKRRSKKVKIGKNALYPHEDERVQAWWSGNKPELDEDDEGGITMEQVKERVSLLRTRETQLQMILILEILALEKLQPQEHAADDSLPQLSGATESQPDAMAPPSSKKRNKHNLPLLVDAHGDRLTIWQSIASDAQLLLQDSQVATPTVGGDQQNASSEPLKDFCIDVLVPFFSSRLPEMCDNLSRKLGGPVIISPAKPKSKLRSLKRTSSGSQKPGAATKRAAPKQEPRTLERALSYEQQNRRSISRAPSAIAEMMRTSTKLPSIKRENSDPDLKEPHQRPSSRSSLSRSTSMADLKEDRTAKKARLEAELKDAISSIRKPNREVVGKAMTEAAERKVTTALSAKKPRKGARVASGSSIIKATPANPRFRNAMPMEPGTPADIPLPSTEDIVPPSSVGPAVPGTLPRDSQRDALGVSAPHVVGHTPLKASSASSFLRRSTATEPMIPPSSPIMARRTATMPDSPAIPMSVRKPASNQGSFASGIDEVPETPMKRRKISQPLAQNMPTPKRSSGLQPASRPGVATARLFDVPETPIKNGASHNAAPTVTATPQQNGDEKKKNPSIYSKLGWDDDDDLDDLM